MADVSVIIPTRNRVELLRRSVSSALAQSEVEVEVIVVDDDSTDGTADMLAALNDDRLHALRPSNRRGLGAARNAGIERAGSPWLAFLDDDDLWSPDKLRRQLDACMRTGAAFGYGGVVAIDERGEPLSVLTLPAPDGLLDALLALNVIPAGASNVIARSSLVRKLGGFDEQFSHVADWDLWIRLAEAAPAAAVAEILTAYRLFATSQHSDRSGEMLAEIDLLDRKHAAVRRRRGVELDRAAVASWLAKRERFVADRTERSLRSSLVRARRRATAAWRGVLGRPEPVPRPDWLTVR